MKYFGIIDKNVVAIFQLQWKIGNILLSLYTRKFFNKPNKKNLQYSQRVILRYCYIFFDSLLSTWPKKWKQKNGPTLPTLPYIFHIRICETSHDDSYRDRQSVRSRESVRSRVIDYSQATERERQREMNSCYASSRALTTLVAYMRERERWFSRPIDLSTELRASDNRSSFYDSFASTRCCNYVTLLQLDSNNPDDLSVSIAREIFFPNFSIFFSILQVTFSVRSLVTRTSCLPRVELSSYNPATHAIVTNLRSGLYHDNHYSLFSPGTTPSERTVCGLYVWVHTQVLLFNVLWLLYSIYEPGAAINLHSNSPRGTGGGGITPVYFLDLAWWTRIASSHTTVSPTSFHILHYSPPWIV